MTFNEYDIILCEILFALLKQVYTDDKRKNTGITTTDRRVFNSDNFRAMLRKDKRNKKDDYRYGYDTRVCNMRHFLEYTNEYNLTQINEYKFNILAWQFDYFLCSNFPNEYTLMHSNICEKRNKSVQRIIAKYKLLGNIPLDTVMKEFNINVRK